MLDLTNKFTINYTRRLSQRQKTWINWIKQSWKSTAVRENLQRKSSSIKDIVYFLGLIQFYICFVFVRFCSFLRSSFLLWLSLSSFTIWYYFIVICFVFPQERWNGRKWNILLAIKWQRIYLIAEEILGYFYTEEITGYFCTEET